MGERRIYNLDGLRGVAAAAVLLGHSAHLIGWRDLFPRFYLAVDFFFLLSGFIMARTYQARLDEGRWRDFLRRRAVRLWPLLIAGTALGLAVALYLGERDNLPLRVALGLACLPLLSPAGLFPLNGPQWSLLFETSANLAHAVLRRGVSTWAVFAVPVALGAGIAACAASNVPLNGGFEPDSIAVGFLRVGFSYSAGIALWRLRLPRLAIPFPLLALAILAPMALPTTWPSGLDAIVILIVWPAALVLGRTDPVRGEPSTWALGWIGALSYPLYILHYPVIRATAHVEHVLKLGSRVSMIVGMGTSIIAAAACLKLFDEPARRQLSRLKLTRRRSAPRAA
jgi:peptidoglycan/LPS O-acetylase OafA/YrhL